MEIFGIGGFEVALIIIIALVVAGPQRMAAWARTMGRWVAKMRQMWSLTAAQLQRELDEAGVDFKVPREIPTRRAIVQELSRSSTVSELRKPIDEIQSALKEGQSAVSDVTSTLRGVGGELQAANSELRGDAPAVKRGTPSEPPKPPRFKPARPATMTPNPPAAAPSSEGFGTWGGEPAEPKPEADFGTWGASANGKERP